MEPSELIAAWDYNPVSVTESLTEKKALCDKDKCPNKDKPNAMCVHFFKIYEAKWEAFYAQHPTVFRPSTFRRDPGS